MQTNKQQQQQRTKCCFSREIIVLYVFVIFFDTIKLVEKCFQSCSLYEGSSLSAFTGPITIIILIIVLLIKIDFVSV